MNSRKSAKQIGATIDRFLRSGSMLRTPPPAHSALLAHPPAPSLSKFLPSRPAADLPPTVTQPDTPYRSARAKLDAGERLTTEDRQTLDWHAALLAAQGRKRAHPHLIPSAEDEALLKEARSRVTRRRPPMKANARRSRPAQIVFPEDEVRRQFYRDHPFEAYRPKSLVEGESIAAEREPKGKEWTELRQRSVVPTPEDAISLITTLHTFHSLPLQMAYTHGISQFRTLLAEHETATRSAVLEARAHGAVFFGEIERGLMLEEKVLDEWAGARAIQAELAAGQNGGPAARQQPAGGAEGIWARKQEAQQFVPEDVQGEVEFTGGLKYVERFQRRAERVEQGVEDQGQL